MGSRVKIMFNAAWVLDNLLKILAGIITFSGVIFGLVNTTKISKRDIAATKKDIADCNKKIDEHINTFNKYKETTATNQQEKLEQISRDIADIKLEQRGVNEHNKAHREFTGKSLERIEKTVASMANRDKN